MRTRIVLGWWLLLSWGVLGVPVAATETGQSWAAAPPGEWPQITMINEMTYADAHFPIGGCAFLIDTGRDTIAATATQTMTGPTSRFSKIKVGVNTDRPRRIII